MKNVRENVLGFLSNQCTFYDIYGEESRLLHYTLDKYFNVADNKLYLHYRKYYRDGNT